MKELERFDAELAKRPMIVAVSKLDLPDVRARVATIKRGMKKRGVDVVAAVLGGHGRGRARALARHRARARRQPAKACATRGAARAWWARGQ